MIRQSQQNGLYLFLFGPFRNNFLANKQAITIFLCYLYK